MYVFIISLIHFLGFLSPLSTWYQINYMETFSPIVYLNSIHMLLSLVVNQSWSLHQLYIYNIFLYGDLDEQVFMK